MHKLSCFLFLMSACADAGPGRGMGPGARIADGTTVLDNGRVALRFERDDTGYRLAEVDDGGFGFALAPRDAREQVSLAFRRGDASLLRIDGSMLTGPAGELVVATPGELVQRWDDQAVAGHPGVHVAIELRAMLEDDAPFAELRASAEVLEGDLGTLERVGIDLRVADADPDGDRDAVVINGRGSQLVVDPTVRMPKVFEFWHPNAGLTLEAWPYTFADGDSRHALYLAVHDPDGWGRSIRLGSDPTSDELTFTVEHVAENPADVSFPYGVAIGAVPGGWYEAGQIHREWILEHTSWLERGRLAERRLAGDDAGASAVDLDFIASYIPAVDPASNTDAVDVAFELHRRQATLDYFLDGEPDRMLVMDWGWSEGTITNLGHQAGRYPPREGYAEVVAAGRALGWKTGGYTLMLGFDKTIEEYERWGVEAGVHRFPDGRLGTRLDPSAPVIVDVLDRIQRHLHGLGFAAVHNDDFAQTGPCFADDHGHAVAGGTYWIDGARRLLRAQEAAGMWNDTETGTLELGPTFLSITGVSTTDMVTTDSSAVAIPLLDTVAHDYQITTGMGWEADPYDLAPFVRPSVPDVVRDTALVGHRAIVATAIAWGQLPLLRDSRRAEGIFDGPMEPVATLLREGIRVRRENFEHVALGRMLEPPATDQPLVQRPVAGRVSAINVRWMPRFPAAAYAGADGDIVIVIVNPELPAPDGVVPEVEITPPDSWGLDGDAGDPIRIALPAGAVEAVRIRAD